VLFHSISYGILIMILYGCYIISVIAWVVYIMIITEAV